MPPVATTTQTTVKLSQLPYPAVTVLLTDGRDPNNYAYSYVYWISWVDGGAGALTSAAPGNPTADPTVRHLGGANWAFADGHVKWFNPRKVKDAYNDAGSQYVCGTHQATGTTGTGANSPNGTDPTLCIN
jgi:prepilin-type processing-associated H-X9-DG protein